jgi:hypothetical protein
MADNETEAAPLARPTGDQLAAFAHLSDRELLVALVVRVNAESQILYGMAQHLPETLKNPMIQFAMNRLIK